MAINLQQKNQIKSNVWHLKKTQIYLIQGWINVFAETETNEEKEICQDTLGKENK